MKKSAFDIDFQNQNLPGKIVAGLERISEAYRVLLWDHAKKLGISPIQIQILIFIKYHREGLCNVSALAKEFNVTKPTISDAIRVLNKKGLIQKITSPVDKRAYSVALSGEGEKMVKETQHFASPIKNVVEKYDTARQEQFFEMLGDLIFQLNKQEIISVQRTCFSCKFFQKNGANAYCRLLEKDLEKPDIRIDCPEYESAG